MGLDVSHGCFHGAYSAFNSLRQTVAMVCGGSHPPHWEYTKDGALATDGTPWGGIKHCNLHRDFPDAVHWCKKNGKDIHRQWWVGDDFPEDKYPGLYIFMSHSDCDGVLTPTEAALVAKDIRLVIPLVEAKKGIEAYGHCLRRGGYAKCLELFADGCELAAKNGEEVRFC